MSALSFRAGNYAAASGSVPAVIIEGCSSDEQLCALRRRVRDAETELKVPLCVDRQESGVVFVTIGCGKVVLRSEASEKIAAVTDHLSEAYEEA